MTGGWGVSWGRSILLRLWRLWSPERALRILFKVQDVLERLIAEWATAYGGGIHPKHRLTRYHDFFVERLEAGSSVLDIGCGIGAVARSIAERVPGVRVTAIDSDPDILRQARALPHPGNLCFLESDASSGLPAGSWDAVILSNVLEHIERRVEFLQMILAKAAPRKILIRVPLFERDWRMPLRRELGVDFRSDPTHCIEHTLLEFETEVTAAGLRIVEQRTLWGEIWAVAEAAT